VPRSLARTAITLPTSSIRPVNMARGKAKTHQDTEEFAGQLKCWSHLAVRCAARV
jgi:hypothetical protein